MPAEWRIDSEHLDVGGEHFEVDSCSEQLKHCTLQH